MSERIVMSLSIHGTAAQRGSIRSRLGLIAAAAGSVIAVVGWWAWASAGPAAGRTAAATSAGGHESPTAYYERLRAEVRASPDTALQRYVAAARQASTIGDLTSCPAVPPPGAELTSNGFYFLTQILPPGIPETSARCGHALACFLGTMVAHQVNPSNPPSSYSEATLVIDRRCDVTQTLTLPDRFVLAGVGTEGRGVLAFDLPDGAVALRFAPSTGAPQRFVTIRDLNIVNTPQCCGQVGLNVSNSSFVHVERVRLHDFGFGLMGSTAYSIFVDQSFIHNNGFNVVMDDGSNAWRVRDTVMSQSGLIGVVIGALALGNSLSGGRIESNPVTGIRLMGLQSVIETTWFEGNGIGFGDHGIQVLSTADQTRILSNLFSSEDILDSGANTQTCFNTDDNAWVDLNNCPH
jgi:hypothetical protein